MNTKIQQIARTAYGFADPEALIALALLAHGGMVMAVAAGELSEVKDIGARLSELFTLDDVE